ncbi:MAG: zinc ribbon domain-containing protein [Promethearchaeota archaeon]
MNRFMPFIINWLLYIIICLVAWAGATNGLKGKKYGGALSLVAGLISIVFYVLFILDPITFLVLAPYSLFAAIFDYWIPYITIESLLMIIGGIIIFIGISRLKLDSAGVSELTMDSTGDSQDLVPLKKELKLRIDNEKILKMNKCYKCGEKIYPNLEKCGNCNTLLLCPQCNNSITGNWKICSNCQIDLDFGRFLLHDSVGATLGLGIITPLIFLILGICIPAIEIFSFHRFSISEIFINFVYLPSAIAFLVWNLFYFICNILIGIFFLKRGKKEFKNYGIVFCIGGLFTITSLLIIRIFLVFMVGILFLSIIHIMGTCELIITYNKIAKNKKKYSMERQKKETEAKSRINEAKNKLLGMIKSEKKVTLDLASQILDLDQNKIRGLIYELIGEDKIKGSFQENVFIVEKP